MIFRCGGMVIYLCRRKIIGNSKIKAMVSHYNLEKKGAGNCEVDSDTNKGVKDINCKWKLLVGAR